MIPDISVSIVSYNTRDLLRLCLAALERVAIADGVTIQIIIADNGSTDDSLAMVQNEFPAALRLELGQNLGYGRANNQAFEYAEGRYFLILNSDTEVEPDSLKNFAAFMDSHADVGAAGARLISPDGSTQISWAREPGLFWTFCEQTFLDRLPFIREMIFGSTKPGAHDIQREVDQICGAALLVRREVFEQVGGFDPKFFMYYEDTDLCVRIRAAGHKIFFLSQVRIGHFLGGSSQSLDIRAGMISSLNESRFYYFRSRNGRASGNLFKAIVLTGGLLRLLIWSGVSLFKPSQLHRQKVKMFREVLRRTARLKESDIA